MSAQNRRVALRDPIFAGALAVLGFLLLCWPVVRSPAMSIDVAAVFVFGVWAAVIGGLAGMARALRPASS